MCKCITFKLYSVFQMNTCKNSIIADASTRCVIFFSRAFLVTSMIVLHPCLPKRNCFQYLLTTLDSNLCIIIINKRNRRTNFVVF